MCLGSKKFWVWAEKRDLNGQRRESWAQSGGGLGSVAPAAPVLLALRALSGLGWDHFHGFFQLWGSGCGQAQAPKPGPCALLEKTDLCIFWGLCCVYVRAEFVFLWLSGRGLGCSPCKVAFAFCMLLFFPATVELVGSMPLGWAECPILCATGKAMLKAGGKLLG